MATGKRAATKEEIATEVTTLSAKADSFLGRASNMAKEGGKTRAHCHSVEDHHLRETRVIPLRWIRRRRG